MVGLRPRSWSCASLVAALLVLLGGVPGQARALGIGFEVSVPAPTVGAAMVETTADTATITVPVVPMGVAATWRVEYGLTTGYGATTAAAAVPLGGAIAQMRTTITGLAADGRYHYRSVLEGPWLVPAVTPDATFDTQTAAIAVDDGDPGGGEDGGGTTTLGVDEDGGAPMPAAPQAPGPSTANPGTTAAPPTTASPQPQTQPQPSPAPKPSTAPRATVTAAPGGAVAIALAGDPRTLTLRLPASAAARARLAITIAGRTRTATLRGARAVRLGAARATVRAGRIVLTRLPARTTRLRVTPTAGTTLAARQVTATAA